MTCSGGIGGTFPRHNRRRMVLVVSENGIGIYRCSICGSYRERWNV